VFEQASQKPFNLRCLSVGLVAHRAYRRRSGIKIGVCELGAGQPVWTATINFAAAYRNFIGRRAVWVFNLIFSTGL
jgi:hypothetical protein